jgi:hypothetical protein
LKKQKYIKMLRLALFSALVLLVATISVCLAQKEHIRQHHRGGALWREVVAQEKQFHSDFGLGEPNTTENWFPQPLYPGQPTPTFLQRYFVDYTGWNSATSKKKLAIIYIPGEGPCTSSLTGYARQWGVEMGAVMVSLENRWYGKSLPSDLTDKDLLMTTLSVDIALSDLSYFIKKFETDVMKLPQGTLTWVAIGGSYSGALSAWMRQSYPNQINCSWSSSGVVHPTFDFHEYDDHISEMLDVKCYKAIKDAYDEFDRLYDNPVTRPTVYQLLQVPDYFTKRDMAFALADQGAGMVQYGRRTLMCDYLLPEDDTQSPLAKYVAMANYFFGAGCFGNCGYSTKCMSDKTYSSQWAGAGYSWFYQCCSEMAWWQVGTPFSLRSEIVSTEYQIDQCRATFTPDILPDTYTFNQKRGGFDVTGTDYVVAAVSADDPWSTVQARVSPRKNYPVYIAQCGGNGCGHCGDLMSPTPTDPADRLAQRQFINTTLRSWLTGLF